MVLKKDINLDRPTCVSKIEQNYSRLEGSVRQVADTLLRSPSEWVGKSISELARESGVSEATVVRFVRNLGYPGYRAFALELARSTEAVRPVEEETSSETGASGGLAGIVRKVFENESRALAEASKTLKNEVLEKAVRALVSARQVYCYAVGNSGLLAGAAEYRFVRLGINCISIRDPIQMAIQTSLLSPKDVVLAFSQTGRNRDAVDGLLLARQAGAVTIGVTSEPGSPLVRASDIPLVLFDLSNSEAQGSLLDAKVAEITLIDALATCIAAHRKMPAKEATRVDKQIEKMLMRQPSQRGRRSSTGRLGTGTVALRAD
jgi:RpiR family transcriptional regulator, carbohydrate utilization regulator